MMKLYFLWGSETNELINLGARLPERFEGPIVKLNGQRAILTATQLSLLVGRFYLANDFTNVRFIDFDEFDSLSSRGIIPDSAEEVGGDTTNSIPLGKYLPEITGEDLRTIIKDEAAVIHP